MTAAKREIIDKIRALRRMTVDKGATEAEAETALRMISKLMAKHQISETEAATPEAGAFERKDKPMRGVAPTLSRTHPTRFAACGIAAYTDTEIAFGWQRLIVVGAAHNIEIAEYLWEMLVSLIDTAWKARRAAMRARYETLASEAREGRRATIVARSVYEKRISKSAKSFKIGMAIRLGERLADMASARHRDVSAATGKDVARSTSTALAIALRQLCPDAKDPRKAKPILVIGDELARGGEAGSKANIHLGIAASTAGTRMIGGKA
ncbi:hypothetical protein Hden_3011 [Hyphomicrobium denitrificans ATCC 51888]|uniref:Uncharacterized protein n=1 Tax=Hyphomicrobium denitrificans (strain ATCC 51888 / DSM 1869 / NCIMB 11706 / TK 0415) TaxID=582899 RepID=D8JVF2_HYPDA|nr:DUF2786 domain-containing protein [Hyphomicrobium denitrificans]ADJ24806.1 hypothetical protein Hden_3011 [Hyphomicrobium denitrificans ATCC 51888]